MVWICSVASLHQANPQSRSAWTSESAKEKKKWINTISQSDLITLNLTPVDAEDQNEWRRTHVADPHLRDSQPEGEKQAMADTNDYRLVALFTYASVTIE